MGDDPKEESEALVLQYGHTIGHAIEFLSGYKFGHGESVGIGMRAAAEISHLLGVSDISLIKQHKEILKKYDLPYSIPNSIERKDIINAIRYNKKFLHDTVQFVLVDKIGSIWNYNGDYSIPCDNDIIFSALKNCYDN